MSHMGRQYKTYHSSATVIYVVICLLLLLVSIGSFLFPKFNKRKQELYENSEITKICELATLSCYYHNVAEKEIQPDPIFRYGLFRYGYKKIWIEYDGIVDVGIDANEIVIDPPDSNGNINVFVPEAKILDVRIDKDSFSEPLTATGMFTSISTEEKSSAVSEAQENMRKEAENNLAILLQAKENTKELIKQYISNIGKLTGNNYHIIWK